jgi:hypothetical protein
MKIFGDWSYVYFLIPSLISFPLCASVVFKVLIEEDKRRKRWHQIVALIAFFSILQSSSWFIGPRYERETNLCKIQEYIFQTGSLYQGIISLVMCATIHHTMIAGRIPKWTQVLVWPSIGLICIVASISCNTATMFCKFNSQHELKSVGRSSPLFVPLVGYWCSYLGPLAIFVGISALYTVSSMRHASRIQDAAISKVARQLIMFPAMMSVCATPLVCWFLVVVVTGEERPRELILVGAVLASSSGTLIAVFYYLILTPNTARQKKEFGSKSPDSLLYQGDDTRTSECRQLHSSTLFGGERTSSDATETSPYGHVDIRSSSLTHHKNLTLAMFSSSSAAQNISTASCETNDV